MMLGCDANAAHSTHDCDADSFGEFGRARHRQRPQRNLSAFVRGGRSASRQLFSTTRRTLAELGRSCKPAGGETTIGSSARARVARLSPTIRCTRGATAAPWWRSWTENRPSSWISRGTSGGKRDGRQRQRRLRGWHDIGRRTSAATRTKSTSGTTWRRLPRRSSTSRSASKRSCAPTDPRPPPPDLDGDAPR